MCSGFSTVVFFDAQRVGKTTQIARSDAGEIDDDASSLPLSLTVASARFSITRVYQRQTQLSLTIYNRRRRRRRTRVVDDSSDSDARSSSSLLCLSFPAVAVFVAGELFIGLEKIQGVGKKRFHLRNCIVFYRSETLSEQFLLTHKHTLVL